VEKNVEKQRFSRCVEHISIENAAFSPATSANVIVFDGLAAAY
jgi:hypothetical protein